MNTMMRWLALSSGNVFATERDSAFCPAAATDMMAMLTQDRALAKKITFYGSALRGNRSYWFRRCGEIINVVNQLGSNCVHDPLCSRLTVA